MTKTQSPSMADTLSSMQQAYSFLHDFHVRLSDTVTELLAVVETQANVELSFDKASTTHTNHPSMRQNPFNRTNRWVWDWFPLYAVQAIFKGTDRPDMGTLAIEVRFKADSRWEGTHDDAPAIRESNAKHSELTLYIWHHPQADQNWLDAWYGSDYPEQPDTVEPVKEGFSAIRYDLDLLTLTTRNEIEIAGQKICNDFLSALAINSEKPTDNRE